MPTLKHMHTYVKYKNRPGFYRCADPVCTHYIDRERILGKFSRCTQCGGPFQLTYEDLRTVNPRCLQCANTKKARTARKGQLVAKTVVENLPDIQALIVPEVEYKDDKF